MISGKLISDNIVSLNNQEAIAGNDTISSEEIGGAESSEEFESSEEGVENKSSQEHTSPSKDKMTLY